MTLMSVGSIAEYPLTIKGLFAVAAHESMKLTDFASAQPLHKPLLEAGLALKVYENRVHPLSD